MIRRLSCAMMLVIFFEQAIAFSEDTDLERIAEDVDPLMMPGLEDDYDGLEAVDNSEVDDDDDDEITAEFQECLAFPWFRKEARLRLRRTSEGYLSYLQRKRFYLKFNTLLQKNVRRLQNRPNRRTRGTEDVMENLLREAKEIMQYKCLLLLE